jgi:hypothetical protein
MYFRWNWEFGSALTKLRNFWVGRGLNPPPRYTTVVWLPVIIMQFDRAVLLNKIDLNQTVVNMVMNPWGPQSVVNLIAS